jgi:hypothetical protein
MPAEMQLPASQTYTRTVDTTPPSITMSRLMSHYPVAMAPYQHRNVANVTVSDGCGNATVTFVSDVVNVTGCTEVTVRTYQAVDACGNAATCSQTYTRTLIQHLHQSHVQPMSLIWLQWHRTSTKCGQCHRELMVVEMLQSLL